MNFFVRSTFVSKYRISAGFVLSDEPVNQTLFSASKSNVLTNGDVFDGYVWVNTDLESGSLAEVDFGADYTFPISDDFAGGKLGGYVELAHWEYPDGRLGDNDKGLITKLNYSGPVDVCLKMTQLLTSGCGREFNLNICKPFTLYESDNGTTIALAPMVSTSYLDNFFADGFSNVQYGADLFVKNGNTSFDIFLRQQEGLQDGFEDGIVVGAGFSYSF
ncbi:MAG: hypothetical protein AABY02_00610 [Nanoarchaeota archaeon]